MDEAMNEEFVMDPERALQTSPVVCLGEASRAAASFNPVLQSPGGFVAVAVVASPAPGHCVGG